MRYKKGYLRGHGSRMFHSICLEGEVKDCTAQFSEPFNPGSDY